MPVDMAGMTGEKTIMDRKPARDKLWWFRQARFGMFIRWGAYAVSGRGECVALMHGLNSDAYDRKYVSRFKARSYDPVKWAQLARKAGCRYIVLTAKHYDGFCLFKTATTDFNACNRGPHRDLVMPYVKACRAAGLKVGLYYNLRSLYLRGGVEENDFSIHHRYTSSADHRFYHHLVRQQLLELFTNYGHIDVLWYDQTLPSDPHGHVIKSITAMARKLQPHVLVNECNSNPNDFDLAKCMVRSSKPGRAWEACIPFAPMSWWGYHRADGPLKSVSQLCFLLQQSAMLGGNLLLNVGPTANGRIPASQTNRMLGIGRWLEVNGESIYGSRIGPGIYATCGTSTVMGERLYIHAFRHEAPECIFRGLLSPVQRIVCLATGKLVHFEQKGDIVRMYGLPLKSPDPVAAVYRVEVSGKLRTAIQITDGNIQVGL